MSKSTELQKSQYIISIDSSGDSISIVVYDEDEEDDNDNNKQGKTENDGTKSDISPLQELLSKETRRLVTRIYKRPPNNQKYDNSLIKKISWIGNEYERIQQSNKDKIEQLGFYVSLRVARVLGKSRAVNNTDNKIQEFTSVVEPHLFGTQLSNIFQDFSELQRLIKKYYLDLVKSDQSSNKEPSIESVIETISQMLPFVAVSDLLIKDHLKYLFGKNQFLQSLFSKLIEPNRTAELASRPSNEPSSYLYFEELQSIEGAVNDLIVIAEDVYSDLIVKNKNDVDGIKTQVSNYWSVGKFKTSQSFFSSVTNLFKTRSGYQVILPNTQSIYLSTTFKTLKEMIEKRTIDSIQVGTLIRSNSKESPLVVRLALNKLKVENILIDDLETELIKQLLIHHAESQQKVYRVFADFVMKNVESTLQYDPNTNQSDVVERYWKKDNFAIDDNISENFDEIEQEVNRSALNGSTLENIVEYLNKWQNLLLEVNDLSVKMDSDAYSKTYTERIVQIWNTAKKIYEEGAKAYQEKRETFLESFKKKDYKEGDDTEIEAYVTFLAPILGMDIDGFETQWRKDDNSDITLVVTVWRDFSALIEERNRTIRLLSKIGSGVVENFKKSDVKIVTTLFLDLRREFVDNLTTERREIEKMSTLIAQKVSEMDLKDTSEPIKSISLTQIKWIKNQLGRLFVDDADLKDLQGKIDKLAEKRTQYNGMYKLVRKRLRNGNDQPELFPELKVGDVTNEIAAAIDVRVKEFNRNVALMKLQGKSSQWKSELNQFLDGYQFDSDKFVTGLPIWSKRYDIQELVKEYEKEQLGKPDLPVECVTEWKRFASTMVDSVRCYLIIVYVLPILRAQDVTELNTVHDSKLKQLKIDIGDVFDPAMKILQYESLFTNQNLQLDKFESNFVEGAYELRSSRLKPYEEAIKAVRKYVETILDSPKDIQKQQIKMYKDGYQELRKRQGNSLEILKSEKKYFLTLNQELLPVIRFIPRADVDFLKLLERNGGFLDKENTTIQRMISDKSSSSDLGNAVSEAFQSYLDTKPGKKEASITDGYLENVENIQGWIDLIEVNTAIQQIKNSAEQFLEYLNGQFIADTKEFVNDQWLYDPNEKGHTNVNAYFKGEYSKYMEQIWKKFREHLKSEVFKNNSYYSDVLKSKASEKYGKLEIILQKWKDLVNLVNLSADNLPFYRKAISNTTKMLQEKWILKTMETLKDCIDSLAIEIPSTMDFDPTIGSLSDDVGFVQVREMYGKDLTNQSNTSVNSKYWSKDNWKIRNLMLEYGFLDRIAELKAAIDKKQLDVKVDQIITIKTIDDYSHSQYLANYRVIIHRDWIKLLKSYQIECYRDSRYSYSELAKTQFLTLEDIPRFLEAWCGLKMFSTMGVVEFEKGVNNTCKDFLGDVSTYTNRLKNMTKLIGDNKKTLFGSSISVMDDEKFQLFGLTRSLLRYMMKFIEDDSIFSKSQTQISSLDRVRLFVARFYHCIRKAFQTDMFAAIWAYRYRVGDDIVYIFRRPACYHDQEYQLCNFKDLKIVNKESIVKMDENVQKGTVDWPITFSNLYDAQAELYSIAPNNVSVTVEQWVISTMANLRLEKERKRYELWISGQGKQTPNSLLTRLSLFNNVIDFEFTGLSQNLPIREILTKKQHPSVQFFSDLKFSISKRNSQTVLSKSEDVDYPEYRIKIAKLFKKHTYTKDLFSDETSIINFKTVADFIKSETFKKSLETEDQGSE